MTRNHAEFTLHTYSIDYRIVENLYIPNRPDGMKNPKWQYILKIVALQNQNFKCICGDFLQHRGELHHAIFSRSDVVGNKDADKIHDLYNVVVLCHNCHDAITREQSVNFLVDIYGYETIKKWYEEFPMKTTKVVFDYYIK